MKARIETRWPELKCVFDMVDMEWSIIQTNYNGEMSLALGQTFKALDERVYRRLERADEQSPAVEDLETAVDRFNDEKERDSERILENISGDAAERLAWAFKRDGLLDHADIYGPKPRVALHNRAVRRYRESD
jgi:hypothetical protein